MKTFILMTVLAATALTGCTSNQKQSTATDNENSETTEVAKNDSSENEPAKDLE